MTQSLSNRYVLLVDEDELTLEMEKMALELVFDGAVKTANTIEKAIAILQESAEVILIAAEHKIKEVYATILEAYLLENKLATPLVICSDQKISTIQAEYKSSCKFIEKTNLIDPLTQVLREAIAQNSAVVSPEYIPIRLATLMQLGFTNYDLYIKLSANKLA